MLVYRGSPVNLAIKEENNMFNTILFVCVGNICRSPVAEGLLKKYSDQYHLNLTISSCGVRAMIGRAPQPYSIELAAEHGIDITDYRAKQITLDMVTKSELILVLDDIILNDVLARFPFAMGKVKKLAFLEQNEDVADPYQQDKDAFIKMYQHIDTCIQSCLKRLWKITIL